MGDGIGRRERGSLELESHGRSHPVINVLSPFCLFYKTLALGEVE
jgi:hypothetical protein